MRRTSLFLHSTPRSHIKLYIDCIASHQSESLLAFTPGDRLIDSMIEYDFNYMKGAQMSDLLRSPGLLQIPLQ